MSLNISNPSTLGKALQQEAVRHQSLLERFRAWRALRAAETELYAFSDRDLADIGLRRQDIPAAVRGEVIR